jgi:type I restriction enzyme S subunit
VNATRVALSEVLYPVSRPEHVSPERTYRILGARWYAGGLFVKDVKTGSEIRAKTLYRVNEGDFVYNRLFAWKGSFAVATDEDDGCFVSNEFPCFTVDRQQLDADYLRWYFSDEAVWNRALGLSSGGTPTSRNRLKEEMFLRMEIPLSRLREQRRIAQWLESVVSGIDQVSLLRAKANKLASWYWPSCLRAEFERLADAHGIRALGDLCTAITDGPHKTPTYFERGIPFVTVRNMVTGKLDFTDINYISPEDHAEFSRRCRPELGDVLYSKDGATRGRACFVDTDREFNIFVSVALIKPLRDELDGRYLAFLLDSGFIKDRMIDKSRGDMIPHIVLREIRDFPVPMPPKPEQERIADRLEDARRKYLELLRLQTETASALEGLKSSLLAAAFGTEDRHPG